MEKQTDAGRGTGLRGIHSTNQAPTKNTCFLSYMLVVIILHEDSLFSKINYGFITGNKNSSSNTVRVALCLRCVLDGKRWQKLFFPRKAKK
jgi:hypothetical protein